MKTWNCWTLGVTCLLLFAACESTGRKSPPQWISATAEAPTEGVLWHLALLTLKEQQFPIGAGANPSTMLATTGWRNSMAPFKGEGYRLRACMRLETIEAGKFKIFLHVEKETNEDLAHPMDLQYAKWEEAPDDTAVAQILLSKIQARVGGALDVGEPRAKLLGKTPK